MIFVVALVIFIKFIISEYLGVIFSKEITVFAGMFLALAILVYEIISICISRLINKIHYDADQREAIETFEKHQLNVGFIVADLPKDQKNNELKDCVEAYITLAKQNLPFVLINSDNVSTSGIYFSGQRGKRDHNKYKIIIKGVGSG
ncbi:hypothetical protein NY744_14955 [Enterobacter hormaechei]|uniref:hypothetical protein n=2 Tax=Enterobacterales TaxID=91347 RepID=UPI0022F13644|nr:hypothetical protein [Enterobacter hormaechei]MDA4623082.1 hypothetical protein [Enterobacter hormaechei]BDV21420.1 hypothetical protein [Escherichia coli]